MLLLEQWLLIRNWRKLGAYCAEKKHIHPKSICISRDIYHRLSSLSLNGWDDSKFSTELDRTAQARVWVLGHHVPRQGSQLLSSWDLIVLSFHWEHGKADNQVPTPQVHCQKATWQVLIKIKTHLQVTQHPAGRKISTHLWTSCTTFGTEWRIEINCANTFSNLTNLKVLPLWLRPEFAFLG